MSTYIITLEVADLDPSHLSWHYRDTAGLTQAAVVTSIQNKPAPEDRGPVEAMMALIKADMTHITGVVDGSGYYQCSYCTRVLTVTREGNDYLWVSKFVEENSGIWGPASVCSWCGPIQSVEVSR